MTPAPQYVVPPPPSWLAGVMPSDDYQVEFRSTTGEAQWKSNPGFQTWGLICPYDEILLGGARGGGKSSALIAAFAMGDTSLDPSDPARSSYLNEPSFRGLILREEYQSMSEFVDEAEDFFRAFNVKRVDDPAVFEFPSGAKIYMNHLGDRTAYNKYKGWGITKIGIEELTQIPQKSLYMKLFASLRNKKQVRVHKGKTYPALRTQIISTTNPDGAGSGWVKERFIEVRDGAGKLIPWNTPMRDPNTGLTRIFIPGQIKDNPYLRDNRRYMGQLLAQDEVTQLQWIHGDWNAGSGAYFKDFRPEGPRGADEAAKYPQANHVIEGAKLEPWAYRWGSCDVGFFHATCSHKFCRNDGRKGDKRVHIYDEFQVRQTDSYEIGIMLAKWWLPELETCESHQVTIYMSPDAFSKTDASKTTAERMAAGIQEVLGPYGAVVLRYNESEREAASKNPEYAKMLFSDRQRKSDGKMAIILKPQYVDRVDGFKYMRELLNFRPILQETEEEIKQRLETVFRTSGVEAYERELDSRKAEPRVLPQLQIWKRCTELIRCLEAAQYDVDETGRNPKRSEDVRKFNSDDEGVGGDDALDGARFGCVAYREIRSNIPRTYWVNERVADIQEEYVKSYGEELTDITRLMMIQNRQQSLYERQNPSTTKGITLPRAGSQRHRGGATVN